jgi:hypothetical protein
LILVFPCIGVSLYCCVAGLLVVWSSCARIKSDIFVSLLHIQFAKSHFSVWMNLSRYSFRLGFPLYTYLMKITNYEDIHIAGCSRLLLLPSS